MAKNWHLASMIAFYADLPDDTFVFNAEDAHNYRIWQAERGGLAGANAVVVYEKEDPNRAHGRYAKKYDKYFGILRPLYRLVHEQPSLIVRKDGGFEEYKGALVEAPRLREFLIFRCYDYNGTFSGPDS
jgi:hypothetical protein